MGLLYVHAHVLVGELGVGELGIGELGVGELGVGKVGVDELGELGELDNSCPCLL